VHSIRQGDFVLKKGTLIGPAELAALKAAGVQYQMHIYPGTQHGFHNDSTPRYQEAAAKLAWQRSVAFFRTHLS
jgi:carboxymethylenebutenolidase